MSDRPRGGGGNYRGGGRGGGRRDHDRPHSDRPRDRSRDRGGERDRHHRADDRDRVHKPSRGGPRSGIGYNDRNRDNTDRRGKRESASAEPDAHSRDTNPPRGPRERKPRRPSPQRTWMRPNSPSAPQPNHKAIMMDLDNDELDEEEKMARVMGFKKFKTTKDTKVPGNEFNYAVRKEKVTKYRQYMNRQGGFNRPLSPSRD